MSREFPTKRYLVKPGAKVRLDRIDPADTSGFDGKKKDGLKKVGALVKMLDPLQELLYAEHKHKVLIVLQAMDTGGKDGTIRRVFEGVNPQGVKVAHFGIPTPEETGHDFLWRVHAQAPGRGRLSSSTGATTRASSRRGSTVWCRRRVWKGRYQEINEFERMLTRRGRPS